MKRRYGCLALAAVLLAGSAAAVHAEEYKGKDGWKAEFTGKAIESNFTSQSFADEVSGLLPGDSIEICVAVKNSSSQGTDWYMSNEVLQSLEDSSAAQGGAYTYVLTYEGSTGPDILYSSESVGGETVSAAGQGLHEATDNLEQFFYLDHLSGGSQGQVRLKVALNGETQGNIYQNTLARLQLNFAVEGAEDDGGDHGDSGGQSRRAPGGRGSSAVYSPGAVQTGDPGGMVLWSAAALVSGVLLLILGVVYQRRSKGGRSMNRCCRIVTGLLFFSMVFSLYRPDCLAAEKKEPYTYQITFYAGNQGIFAGADGIEVVDADNRLATGRARVSASASVITVGGLKAGDTVTFDDIQGAAVGLEENSRYYVRGLRKGGYDNDTVDQPAFRVEQDQDYVVAYGVRGDMVSYVIHYQDAAGNTLAPSRTYYGNVGDRPVVAFLYIEGYEPQAYNLTRTLSKNETENVFIFVYSPAESGGSQGSGQGAEEGSGGSGEDAGDAGTAAAAPGPGPAAAGAAVPGVGAAGAGGAAGGDGAGAADGGAAGEGGGGAAGDAGGVAAPDEDVPLDEGPEDLVDLDRVEDEQIPLVETIPEGTRNMLGAAAVGVTASAALLALAVILVRRRRKEAAEED